MKCSINGCERIVYENGKCIFHCEKTLENGWISKSSDKYNDKIKLFWKEFRECYKKNITESFKDYGFSIGFVIPFYHTNLSALIDIRELKELSFWGCLFVDGFIINDDNDNNLNQISFNNCTFNREFYIGSVKLDYLFIAHNTYNSRFTIQNATIKDGEILDIKTEELNKTTINLVNIEISNKLEIWNSNNADILLEISDSKFQELEIKGLNTDTVNFNYKNKIISKLKIIDSNLNKLSLENIDFLTNSKVLFENLKCKNLYLSQIAQDSTYIQFHHIQVTNNFICDRVEFKNTYFNDFDISKANKTIEKTSFIDSHLNSINWGKIFQIKAKRDLFRQLKFVNDTQGNNIEANNFYVMEMQKYKVDILDNKKWLSNWWQEKLIFNLNKKISNFSQSWFLPLLWIFIINIGFYLLTKISNISFNIHNISFSLTILIFIFIFTKLISEISKSIQNKNISYYVFQHLFIIISMLVIINIFDFGSLKDIMWFSNIQSYKDFIECSKEKDIFKIWTIHKILLGFLIYHFIISLRRQTKR